MRTLCLLLLAACSGTGAAKPTHCVDRSGSYRVTWTERSGDCGPISEQVIVLDPMTVNQVTTACKGTITTTGDNCSVTSDLVCTLPSGTVSENRATIHWSEDSSIGGGIVQLVLRADSNGPGCNSTYDESYTRL